MASPLLLASSRQSFLAGLLFLCGALVGAIFVAATSALSRSASIVAAIVLAAYVLALVFYPVKGILYSLAFIFAPRVAEISTWGYEAFVEIGFVIFLFWLVCGELVRSIIPMLKTPEDDPAISRSNGAAGTFRRILGIPPTISWVQGRGKRWCAAALFAASQIFLSILTLLALYVFPSRIMYFRNYRILDVCGWPVSQDCLRAFWPFLLLILVLFVFLFAAGVALRHLGRRLCRVGMEKVRKDDTRPPLLFLRSFKDDQVRLAPPRRSLWRQLMFCGNPRPFLDHVLLEEGIRLGPVIAIGAPGRRPPFGIARAYASDAEWQDLVARLAQDATMIVIAIDETEGLRWELELTASRWMDKTLFLLPPRLAVSEKAAKMLLDTTNYLKAYRQPTPETVGAFFGKLNGPVLGWHIETGQTLSVFTVGEVSEVAYTLAIRRFVMSRSKPSIHP
jgi:hypothetical protein